MIDKNLLYHLLGTLVAGRNSKKNQGVGRFLIIILFVLK